MSACSRASDTVARSGDDEFTVVLEDLLTPGGAYDFGARVLEAVAAPFTVAGRDLPVTARLGIAVSDGSQTAADLLSEAALALQDGRRNRYQVFETGMRAEAEERLALRAGLVSAIDAGEIVPFYQPIVDLTTRRVVGYEGLVRWRHPELGLLAPDRFLGVAEQAGVMDAIGSHMIRTACADAARLWPDSVSVAVNLSGGELQGRKLVATVQGALDDSGLAPGRLTLEVTEHSVIADMAAAASTLCRLAEEGVAVAVDDFGTGHASLTYLERFPINQLKIDRSFVRSLGDEAGRRLVGAIVALGRTLGHEVVAEGVETEDQAAALVTLGCRLGQGYLFGKPAPAAALGEVEPVG